MDEGQAVFMKCEVQFLDRATHVVSFLLGSTIISDDGSIRVDELGQFGRRWNFRKVSVIN